MVTKHLSIRATILLLVSLLSIAANAQIGNEGMRKTGNFKRSNFSMSAFFGPNPAASSNFISAFATLSPEPTFKYGFGFAYIYNVNKRISLELGLYWEARTDRFNTKMYYRTALINSGYNNISPVNFFGDNFLLQYRKSGISKPSYTIPILFNYKLNPTSPNVFSLKLGIGIRYYLSSTSKYRTFVVSDTLTEEIFLANSVSVDVNLKRKPGLDAKVGFGYGILLKNHRILQFNFMASLPVVLTRVDSEVIFFEGLPNFESRGDYRFNQASFGFEMQYIFTRVPNPKKPDKRKWKVKVDGFGQASVHEKR